MFSLTAQLDDANRIKSGGGIAVVCGGVVSVGIYILAEFRMSLVECKLSMLTILTGR